MPRHNGRIVSQPNHYLNLIETQVFIPDDNVEYPLFYKHAMNNVEKDQLAKAMDLEMKSMYFNSMHEVHFSKDKCSKTPQKVEDMRCIPHASTVGNLIYAMLYTRPAICYTVGVVSRYQSNPRLDQWTMVKIILKGSRKFMLGSMFTLNKEVVVWCSIKQGCIVDFIMEVEYVLLMNQQKKQFGLEGSCMIWKLFQT
ncbi:gag/pol protein [Cucumis melo var. makuwa]|uniref:Gag/pol protein n=1 Tax=Cucumis melo var. makuwa TaxID=1194695 RepID=A0A5D3DMK6_CUCMM|nr:gag/pol protein [Cucumis melo var. makuwa]TYK24857.1 gag/pol protein [Cucumis melo var. makuwa]